MVGWEPLLGSFGDVVVRNTSFVANAAAKEGGGVYCSKCDLTMSQISASGNKAPAPFVKPYS